MKFKTKMIVLKHELTVDWTLLLILNADGNVVNSSFSVEKVEDPESLIAEVKTDSKNPKPQCGDLQGTVVSNIAAIIHLDLSQIGKMSKDKFIARVEAYDKMLHSKQD